MEQKYNIEEIRISAEKCAEVAKEIKFNESSMIKLNEKNAGKVKNKIDELIKDMSVCTKDTQIYMTNTAKFIQSVATHFEKMDKELDKKIKES